MDNQNKNVLFGLYDDEVVLMKAVKKAKEQHLDIMDVYTPFPVHGLDPILGLKESRLHIAGFIYGSIGGLFGFLAMTWIFTSDWPIIFGGKPYWSVPAFIPITFELTVLVAAVGMVLTFFIVSGLSMTKEAPILHDRITDDKFCIAFDTSHSEESEIEKLKGFFSETSAEEVHSKTI